MHLLLHLFLASNVSIFDWFLQNLVQIWQLKMKISRSEEFHFGGSSGEKCHISCSSLWLHMNCVRYTVCCWIAMAQNEQEMPWASQQQLAHNSCWEKQSFHRLLFLCLFGLFTPSHECICDRFHHRQCYDSRAGIFKWNFDHFLLETVKCEGIWINVWLLYMVNVQYFVQDLHRFQIGFLKKS